MATVSLEEKRLKQLKQQLFGKSDSTLVKINPKQLRELNSAHRAATGPITFESISLKSDLIRITVLSAIAVGIQLSLFIAQQNGLLKFF